MKTIFKSKVLGLLSVLSFMLLLPTGVSAQSSGLLPDQISNIFGLLGEDGGLTASFITGRVRVGLIIALALLILVAVVYALIAAFKYIQSQGDPGKIEEAQKAIKAIFYGVAAMMIGIVGIVLVFVFFSASRPAAELYQVCLSAPNSEGCQVCIDEGNDGANLCFTCEEEYADNDGVASTAECLPG
jgi:fumarate reductase subunit D